MSKCEGFYLQTTSSQILQPKFNGSRIQSAVLSCWGHLFWGPNHSLIQVVPNVLTRYFVAKSSSRLTGSQVELHLLRACLSICKVSHFLKSDPYDRISFRLGRFHSGLRRCLERILRSSLPDLAWSQATLPIRLGALGPREACTHTQQLLLQL